MIKCISLLATLVILIGSCAIVAKKPDKDCSVEDFVNYVKAGKECLAIQVSSRKTKAKTLVIYLHGAVSKGDGRKPADYFTEFGTAKAVQQASTSKNSIGIVIMRPGYHTSDKRYSTGNRAGKTTKSHNNLIAAGILRLKKHYGASQVIVVGHSNGAQATAAIIGQYHGIIDTAILVSCGCDTKKWADSRSLPRPYTRQNPMDFVLDVYASVRVIAINSEDDKNTKVIYTTPYISALEDNGVRASFMPVPGYDHDFQAALKKKTIKVIIRAVSDVDG